VNKLILAKDRPVKAHKQESRHTGKVIERVVGTGYSTHSETEHRTVELEGLVTVTIDLEAIIKRLGTQAIKSKGKRAQEAGGAIVVTARNVREVAATDWRKL
jgi:hypothetical protein